MFCPFSGKPCLFPKNILSKEEKDGKVEKIYMCSKCGKDYLEKLEQPNTKLVEITPENADIPEYEIQTIESDSPKEIKIYQIKKIEAQLQEAIDEEDFEKAAELKELLKSIDIETNEQD